MVMGKNELAYKLIKRLGPNVTDIRIKKNSSRIWLMISYRGVLLDFYIWGHLKDISDKDVEEFIKRFKEDVRDIDSSLEAGKETFLIKLDKTF